MHYELSLANLPFAAISAETIKIFNGQSDHVWLLSTDILKFSESMP